MLVLLERIVSFVFSLDIIENTKKIVLEMNLEEIKYRFKTPFNR